MRGEARPVAAGGGDKVESEIGVEGAGCGVEVGDVVAEGHARRVCCVDVGTKSCLAGCLSLVLPALGCGRSYGGGSDGTEGIGRGCWGLGRWGWGWGGDDVAAVVEHVVKDGVRIAAEVVVDVAVVFIYVVEAADRVG